MSDPLVNVERLLLGHSSGDPSLDGPLLLEVEREAVRLLIDVAREALDEAAGTGIHTDKTDALAEFAAGLGEDS